MQIGQVDFNSYSYMIVVGVGYEQAVAELVGCARTKSIKYVVVTLLFALHANARLLQ